MKTQYIIPKFEVSELQPPFSPPKNLNEQSEKEFKKIKQPRPQTAPTMKRGAGVRRASRVRGPTDS